jgi:DNA polymerase III delta subunit
MNLFELMTGIKLKNLPKFLVFCGPEYAIMDIYVDKIAQTFNLKRANISNVQQVVKPQRAISLIGDNNLYICRYDTDFIKNEKSWSNIDAKLGSNKLILICGNLDKRGKFYKSFENNLTEFVEQDHTTVVSMVNKQIDLDAKYVERLVTGCENNYSRCLLEINKIKSLANAKKLTSNEAYENLLKDGTICEVQDSKLQEFTNSVLTRNSNCFAQYKALIRSGEPNMIILTWLYNAVRNQLSVQTVNKPTVEILGISYFFIKECQDRQGYYTNKELRKFLDVIRYCEQGIKLGWMEDSLCIDYILASVM